MRSDFGVFILTIILRVYFQESRNIRLADGGSKVGETDWRWRSLPELDRIARRNVPPGEMLTKLTEYTSAYFWILTTASHSQGLWTPGENRFWLGRFSGTGGLTGWARGADVGDAQPGTPGRGWEVGAIWYLVGRTGGSELRPSGQRRRDCRAALGMATERTACCGRQRWRDEIATLRSR